MGNKEEFSQELNQYIEQRSRNKLNFAKLFSKVSQKKIPEEIDVPEMQEEQAVEEQKQDTAEEPGRSGFTRFLEKIGLVSAEEEENTKAKELLETDETKDDLKEVAKITLAVIKQLPEDQMSAFKNSPDFERLKTVLRKHGLIK